MARSLQQMADVGAEKMRRKSDSMRQNYYNSVNRAVQTFQDIGFGPTIQQNYAEGVRNAEYRAPDPDKWMRNWLAAMQR